MFAFCLLAFFPLGGGDVRPAEPLVVSGQQLLPLHGAPVDELYLYSFRMGAWVPMAFQIDERDASGSLFVVDDGLLDDNDELVFQPQEAGDAAGPGLWIADGDSRHWPRLELQISDGVTAGQAHAYLYRSASLNGGIFPQPCSYDPPSDTWSTPVYRMGFHPGLWIWDSFSWWEGAAWGPDLLDREKWRLRLSVLGLPIQLSEENVTPSDLRVVWGPVRLSRAFTGTVTVLGQSQSIPFFRQAYASWLGGGSTSLNNDGSMNIQEMRLSVDLDATAVGATIANPNNVALTVDGLPDNPVTAISPSQAQAYWSRVDFAGKAWLQTGSFSGVGTASFYHWDQAAGGTADGTADTGDLQSFGDAGLLFSQIQIGQHQIGQQFLVDASGLVTPAALLSTLGQPFTVQVLEQTPAAAFGALLALWRQTLPGSQELVTVATLIPWVD